MMDKSANNLENIFKEAFSRQSATPSSRVLRKIRLRLWVSDFFSVKLYKFNVVYTALLMGGLASGIFLVSDRGKNEIENNELIATDNLDIEKKKESTAENKKIEPVIDKTPVEKNTETHSLPVALFESDFTKGCAPLKIQFFNKSSSADKVIWDFGNGDRSLASDPVYTFSKPGTYKVSLIASNSYGNTATYTQMIKVLNSPLADFSVDIENSTIANKEIMFKNESEEGIKYIWDFGDNTKDSGYEITHAYKDFGTYHVSLIAIADNGCMDTITRINKFIEHNFELYFPFSFRPNPANKSGNGYYEKAGQESSIFYPRNYGAKEYELHIYAPNGVEIFKTKNIKQGWNGFIRGRLAPGGIYTYKTQGIYPNGKPFELNGKVKVIVEDYYQN